ncbi:MAG: hypothetical protein J6W89_05120 [Paludibacteraceae bacterium]|nr:hypothetical protein [Paludibacteraceae bacterium]
MADNNQPNTNKPLQVKSRERVQKHGEVFTAKREVNAMLDLVKNETERIDSRFLEPACGDGNFLIEILRRKLAVVHANWLKHQSQLQYEKDAILAISSMYGIDILPDNAAPCRARLLSYFQKQYCGLFPQSYKPECISSAEFLLSKNIILGDALTYRRIDNSDEWIIISEWSMLPNGMMNRRDYEFSYLVGDSSADDLFSDIPCQTFAPQNFLNLNANAYGE